MSTPPNSFSFPNSSSESAQTPQTPVQFVKGKIYSRKTDIHGPFGGSLQPGITRSSKSPVVFIFTGETGKQYGYHDDASDDGVYSYTGEGQIGHMEMTGGNRAILQHAKEGRSLHLFKSMGKGKGHKYIDEFCCASHSWGLGPDRKGDTRKIIIFRLVPVSTLTQLEDFSEQQPNSPTNTLTLSEARDLALNASATPQNQDSKAALRTIYVRSQRVKDYVLMRAEGVCESCGDAAPFFRKNGTPYLEPHHINRLSDGGIDHPAYVGAICPACHREIHFGQHGTVKNEALRDIVQKKEKAMS